MTTIQDRLSESAARTHREVAGIDVEGALAAVTADASPVAVPPRRSWTPLLVAAALVLAIAVTAIALVVRDEQPQVVADAPSTTAGTSPTTAGGPPIVPVAAIDSFVGVAPAGSVRYAGTADAFADHWAELGTSQPPPPVDFDHRVVLIITLAEPDGCDSTVAHLTVKGTQLAPEQPALPVEARCTEATDRTRTSVVSVDRADLPADRFSVVVPAQLNGPELDQILVVDLSQASAGITPTTTAPDAPPDGPDLQAAEPGYEITFDRAGDVRLGDRLDPSAVTSHEGTDCGYWGPPEPSHDGEEPPSGLVSGATTASPAVLDIRVRQNLRYRTASGVGIGTTLATLQRVYGQDLVVDRADGWDRPTDGLLASYQDVAAVRNGDHAMTFLLRGDAVEQVKIGPAQGWGDDEGCA